MYNFLFCEQPPPHTKILQPLPKLTLIKSYPTTPAKNNILFSVCFSLSHHVEKQGQIRVRGMPPLRHHQPNVVIVVAATAAAASAPISPCSLGNNHLNNDHKAVMRAGISLALQVQDA
jgi:hypothetical protein